MSETQSEFDASEWFSERTRVCNTADNTDNTQTHWFWPPRVRETISKHYCTSFYC